MTKEEIRSIVWQELQKWSASILTGVSANAADAQGGGAIEDIGSLYPGLPNILAQPVMAPYGFASKSPANTPQVVGKGGNHPLNRIILGHYDTGRPPLNAGEAVLYNQYGQQVRLENGKIKVGSAASAQPLVLGTILKTMLSTVLDAIATHTHICSAPGSPGATPVNASVFSGQKSSPVDDGKMLSKQAFTE